MRGSLAVALGGLLLIAALPLAEGAPASGASTGAPSVVPAGCGGFRTVHNMTDGSKVHCITRSWNRINLHLAAILPPRHHHPVGIAEFYVTMPRPGLLGFCNETLAHPHPYDCHGINGQILNGSPSGGWVRLTVRIR